MPIRPLSVTPLASVVTFAFTAIAYAQVHVDIGGGENQAVVARQAATDAARAELNGAMAGLQAARDRVRADFKAAPELWDAEDELEAAQAEFEAAAQPVLARLSDSPEFKEEKKKQDELDAQLQQAYQASVAANPASTRPSTTLPQEGKPGDGKTAAAESQALNVPVPSDAQIAAATDKAVQRNKLRQMQQAAIANDPKAAEAAARVDAAVEKLKRLQLTYRADLLNNPEFKAALDQVHSARTRVQQAAAQNYGYGAYGGYR